MQTIELPDLAEYVSALPAEGAARDRQLYRLIDRHASAMAAAALHAAASRSAAGEDVLSLVLESAEALLTADGDVTLADPSAYETLRRAAHSPELLSLVPTWIRELRQVALVRPESGACTLGTALELWSWTMNHFLTGKGSQGDSSSQIVDELTEALAPILAARCLVLEVAAKASGAGGDAALQSAFSHVQAARVSGVLGATCAELVFGYRSHQVWDSEGCAACYAADELDDLEALMPGIASGTRLAFDVIESDGSHAVKAGPCARFDGVNDFTRLRNKLDACLTGSRLAKQRAAESISRFPADPRKSNRSKGRA
ncbi:MAG: hypothetical protein WBX15_10800 [Thermoanaerobaculia bacterium]